MNVAILGFGTDLSAQNGVLLFNLAPFYTLGQENGYVAD